MDNGPNDTTANDTGKVRENNEHGKVEAIDIDVSSCWEIREIASKQIDREKIHNYASPNGIR